MHSVPLNNATRRIGAPVHWDHERNGICRTLEVRDQNGWMISGWTPTPAEIKRMIDGCPVFLYILGNQHPVVSMEVGETPVIKE